jgi:hypothetical protein
MSSAVTDFQKLFIIAILKTFLSVKILCKSVAKIRGWIRVVVPRLSPIAPLCLVITPGDSRPVLTENVNVIFRTNCWLKKKAGTGVPAFCFMGNVFLNVRLLRGYWSSSLSTQPQSEPVLTE